MPHARLSLDPAFVVAPVSRKTFGTFVEHLGRCVYGGIHDPGHPTADEDGFRGDVLQYVRDLGISTVRYPGGNFVSGYRWEDGVGPVDERPVRKDLAWHSTEPNTVGLDEFMKWARKAEVEPMMAVNLGTRGVQEAIDLLDYANGEGGSFHSDLRKENGAEEPYGIKMWCLGNEMDGPWQIGHKTAKEYGRLAAETARAMRLIDPDLTLVACGSSGSAMPTFGTWEREVLEEAYDEVDLISMHAYYWEKDGDLASFLASGVEMDHFIEDVIASVDHVRAAKKATKRINISFDEWNVWYLDGEASKNPETEWPVAPVLLEDQYSVADAVVVGSLLISLLKHSDRVVSASLAQLVNVIAPIMTETGGRSWKQTTYHPFAQASKFAQGDVLRGEIQAPTYETAKYGEVPAIDAVATHDAATGDVAVFAVNRSLTESIAIDFDTRSFGAGEKALNLVEATTLHNPDPYLTVTVDTADSVAPEANGDTSWEGSVLTVILPPLSWNVVRLAEQ
ncbi:alpha-N-arabinofuranosidase [Frondihabitans sucicola]|uniref:non-reducing end alpha-L-arabinofuranosidase n=1 Tax=Frondihabitans sucicola TaxID=1268041 RepID=A0ABN6Y3R4_9MICO|nr:alpha-N-arabinofuranosidase [Frondihabitans sucicola]BDZ51959.1 alpha-N-arabinofuranosidase [Frondihabitans sucicola]